MSRNFRQYQLILLLLVIMILPVTLVHASAEILPVAELQPGMRGVARTVVSGTAIQDFDVEVLGVMKNKGPAGDLILVRTSGDIIDKSGGIAQGMSGSPVYIDGKLVGAIAYGWSLTDHRIGMVTPIQDMLKLWDLPDKVNQPANSNSFSADADSLSTPLMASGFSERALGRLTEKLKPFNLVPYATGTTAGSIGQTEPLKPGSPVGVALINGDISLGALGTVTYVEGDKVLAFGHPFLKKGNTNYLMTEAHIWTTVAGLESSFKVGTTGAVIGTVNQDRSAGIAGQLNQYPSVIPIKVTVRDNALDKASEYTAQLVQDEQLSPILAENTVFNAIDKTIDRIGMGTAQISFEITARSMPGEVLKRDNMFFHPGNISGGVTGEFFEALTMLTNNQYHAVDILDINVNVNVNDNRRIATIVEAKPFTTQAKPGDKVLLNVKLKPYRGDSITRTIAYTIPKDQAPGPLTLEVRGGGTIPLTQLLLRKQGIDESLILLQQDKYKNSTFKDVIKDFNERDRNNDIVVEPLIDFMAAETVNNVATDTKTGKPTPGKALTNKETAKDTAKETAASDETKNKASITTDYIIDSETQVVINVVK